MKIIEKKVNVETKMVQLTTTDERWYKIGNQFVPSVTWIAGFYPKGVQFYKWLADKGWDEAEAIKQAAGDKGSKVHKACEDILLGHEVKMNDKYLNPSTEQQEELTVQEYECLMSFVEWLKVTNPEVIKTEYTVWNQEHNYAGTIDMKLKINGEPWLVDLKTSLSIWPEYELQLSAYRHAEDEVCKTAILQIGYNRNKNQKYKFTEIENRFDLFLSAKKIWEHETEGIAPLQRDYPLSLEWKSAKQETKIETEAVEDKKVVNKKTRKYA
jgi:hypothetical protein